MNSKSDWLDELRLEVGMVPDYAHNLREFYIGIVKTFGKYIDDRYAVGLFLVNEHQFQLLASIGTLNYFESETFGEGNLSLCAVRGKISIHELVYQTSLLVPFYCGHHLKGILVINVPRNTYSINEEDYIFLKELSTFIERQQKKYERKHY